jgi:hypothetical protein
MADTETLFIMRVGDYDGNFKLSVRDRIETTDILHNKLPIWGYNKSKCKNIDLLIREKVRQGSCYVFFLPKGSIGICGLAKLCQVSDRNIGPLIALDETDEEIGWTTQNNNEWDVEIRLDRYWDLTKILNNSILDLQTIRKLQILSPASLHKLSETSMQTLYKYLCHHCSYIINNIQPSYKNRFYCIED